MMDGTVQREGLTGNGIDHAIQSEIDRDDSDSCRNDEQEHPHLRIEGFPDAAQKQQVVTAEIDGKQQHEHRHNGLQVVGIACHTVVPDAETAGSGGAEGSAQGIEHTHPTAEQEDKLNNCQRHVERVQNHGSGAHARHQLAHRGTGAFRLHDVHIPPAGERNERHDENQYAHTAHPVRKTTPDQRGVRQPFHFRQDGGSRGGKAGHGLKQGVHEGWDFPGQPKRECTHQGEQNPTHCHDDKAFAGVQCRNGRLAPYAQPAQKSAQRHGAEIVHNNALTVHDRRQRRNRQKNAFKQQKPADDMPDHAKIHSAPLIPVCRSDCAETDPPTR